MLATRPQIQHYDKSPDFSRRIKKVIGTDDRRMIRRAGAAAAAKKASEMADQTATARVL